MDIEGGAKLAGDGDSGDVTIGIRSYEFLKWDWTGGLEGEFLTG